MLKKNRSLWIFGVLVHAGFAILVWLAALEARVVQAEVTQGILYVAPDGNCGATAPCFDDVQAAVDAAADGDEIRIAAGNYTQLYTRPVPPGYQSPLSTITVITQAVYITKPLTIQGGYTISDWVTADPVANPTVFDVDYGGRVFVIAGNITTTLEGLQIGQGNASNLFGLTGDNIGAGVFVLSATVTIKENTIISNTAGGGVGLVGGIAEIVNNRFEENGRGLWLYRSIATVSHNLFAQQTINGVEARESHILLDSNVFADNFALSDGAGAWIVLSQATIRNNAFANNKANNGGALATFGSQITVTNNLMRDNVADVRGGAMHIAYTQGLLVNNAVVGNHLTYNHSRGSGILLSETNLTFVHTTLSGNTGGDGSALYVERDTQLTMTNTVVSDQVVGVYLQTSSNHAFIDHTLWFHIGTTTGGDGIFTITNNYSGDPALASDGYHLTSFSAAIDKGLSTFVSEDIDGTPRPVGAAPDLGADEFPELTERLYLPVLLRP